MSIDPHAANAATSQNSGNELPDLHYVSQLFSLLDGSDSGSALRAANDPGAAPVDEEHVPMTTDSLQPIVLPAQCLLRDAVEMKPLLMQQADQKTLCIDVSALERIDAAFMQALLALAKQRKVNGRGEIQWQGDNAVFVEAAQVLGLTRHFKVEAAA